MKDTIDLIPREMLVRRNVRARAGAWVSVGAASLAALLIATISLVAQARKEERAVADLRARVEQLRPVRDRLPALRKQLEDSLAQQQLVSRLLVEPGWNRILSDLSGAMSGDVWVNNVQIEQPPEQEQGTAASAGTILVAGSAAADRDLVQFMNRFGTSPWLQGLVLQQSRHEETNGDTQDDTARVNFVLQGTLRKGVSNG